MILITIPWQDRSIVLMHSDGRFFEAVGKWDRRSKRFEPHPEKKFSHDELAALAERIKDLSHDDE